MKTKLVIFGITGDLSHRKLLPALDEIIRTGEQGDLMIVGVSRREVEISSLLEGQPDLIPRTSMFTMDLSRVEDYGRLKEFLALASDEQALIYLAVPPGAAADIVDFLGQAGINTPNVKLLFEKPFGFDYVSAKDFIDRTGRYFTESQLYRIDHYMAKEVAQQVIALRADAENHHHHWSNDSIARVDIIAAETLGVKDRATFYEQTGALRDVIQGHLMQLLALVLMDPGAGQLDAELPLRRFRALEQLAPADPVRAVRAQYEGYDEDVGNPGSLTESFAAVELESTDSRWVGVPLLLATGKNLNLKQTAITITYKDGTTDHFEEAIIPVEGRLKDAYERVLVEAIAGRKNIFTTSPEILRAWQILAPIQEQWALENNPPRHYSPGTDLKAVLARLHI